MGIKGIECIFLWYVEHSKGYRFLVIEPNSSIEVNNVIESKNAIFYENNFTTIPKPTNSNTVVPVVREDNKRNANEEPPKFKRSKKARKERTFGPDFIMHLVEDIRDSHINQTAITQSIKSDPLTYEKAMKSNDSAFWKEAKLGSL